MQNLPLPYRDFVASTQADADMPADARYGRAWHHWHDNEQAAVVQAWASDRPLLLRGEAGCGKSQLARAVAHVLKVPLITEVIHPRYEATDLLYREDPVKRLAHAQLLATIKRPSDDEMPPLDWLSKHLPAHVERGALWRAMTAPTPAGKHPHWPRSVVLIDEIDKADSDVPNALLEALGNRSFQAPGELEPIQCNTHRPLIMITTNEDRELPPAFVRRCAVLNMQPEGVRGSQRDQGLFVKWLVARAKAHKALTALDGDDQCPMAKAAQQVWKDRMAAEKNNLPTVGLAEYLDLLYSLQRLSGGDPARANELMHKLSAYALVKHREQDQQDTGRLAGA